MTEKDYLQLLKKQIQPKRVVCGFNQNIYGEAVITTGIPRQYNEGQITYVKKKTMSYNDYMSRKIQKPTKRRR